MLMDKAIPKFLMRLWVEAVLRAIIRSQLIKIPLSLQKKEKRKEEKKNIYEMKLMKFQNNNGVLLSISWRQKKELRI